ncbi:MAG: EAL domain-containing protein [Actinobacteria bacterium]|nr:MAG: EAL domain-containing protein [Actinomycetota bacterium]
MRERSWAYFIVGSAVFVAAGSLLGETGIGAAIVLIAVGSACAAWLGGRWWSQPDHVPFRLYATGALLFSAGTIVRELLAGFDIVNSPNVADLIDASGYIAMILATLRLVQKRTKGLDPTNLLDSLVAVGGVAVPMWIFVILPFTRHSSISVGDRSVELVFTVLSLVLFGAFCRLAIGPGARNISYYMLAIGGGATVALEVSAGVGLAADSSFVANTFFPLLFGAVGFTLLGAAALHPQVRELTESATEPVVHITHARFALLCGAIVTPPIVMLADRHLVRAMLEEGVIIVCWMIIAVMVIVRLAGVARGWERARNIERILSRAAARLASSTEHSHMTDAAFSAAHQLANSDRTRISYVSYRSNVWSIERSEGWQAERVGATVDLDSPALRAALDETRSTGLIYSAAPDFPGEEEWWTAAPMMSRGSLLGLLVAVAPDPLGPSFPDALANLATDFASALDTAMLAEQMHRARVERRFRALIEHSDDIVIVVSAGGTASFSSPAASRLLGLSDDDLRSTPIVNLAVPEHRAQFSELIATAASKPAPREIRLESTNGTTYWFEIVVADVRSDPEIDGIVVTARQIDDRKAAELQLAASEARFRGLVQHGSDVVAVVDHHGFVNYISASVTRVLGHEPHELVGHELSSLVHPDDRLALTALLFRLSTDPSAPHRAELRMAGGRGEWRTLDLTMTDLTTDPAVNGVVVNAHDVTERKALEQDLRHQALHDALTGLPNRVLFRDRVQQALDRRGTGSVVVMVIDIDDFKTINDAVGHAIGDNILHVLGLRLEQHLRAGDTLARLGGDEFSITVEDGSNRETVASVARRILEEVRIPITYEEHEFVLDASIGIVYSEDCDRPDPEIMMRNADMALHAAKSRGKGRFVVYDSAMHSGVLERLELKGDLVRAVENDELVLYYQPIVSLRTRRITGFEALMRWNHPERGMVSPGSFISLAEETGLIVPMGRWLFDAAFSQLAKWRVDHEVTMSVNLSPRQLDAANIVDDISSRLVTHGLDPSWVTLELTETGLVDGGSINHARLEAIRALGVKVAADDFGSGYASYAALAQLPYTGVKIDMSLVQALEGPGSEKAQAQVRSLCEMAKALGLTVVAEGVEAGEQASLLITLGCDFAQGYYFSPPVAAQDADHLVEHGLQALKRR